MTRFTPFVDMYPSTYRYRYDEVRLLNLTTHSS
jgi:hypothetical protein